MAIMKGFIRGLGALIIGVMLLGVMMFCLVMYSPWYTNLKSMYVCTAYSTMNHRFLVNWFLPQSEIQSILKDATFVVPVTTNSDDAQVHITSTSNSNVVAANSSQSASSISVTSSATPPAIEEKLIYGNGFKGTLVLVHDPTKVHLYVSSKLNNGGEKVGQVVDSNPDIFAAINAGGFADTNNTVDSGVISGACIYNGKLVAGDEGEIYPFIGLANGILTLYHGTSQQALARGIQNAVTFTDNSFLIVNGVSMIKNGDGGWGIDPRTAIGQQANGTILLLEIDGRQPLYSVGATLADIVNIMLENGAITCANLDGGSSSIVYYNRTQVSRPSGSSKLGRALPTMWVADK